jgi:hypothetical protein
VVQQAPVLVGPRAPRRSGLQMVAQQGQPPADREAHRPADLPDLLCRRKRRRGRRLVAQRAHPLAVVVVENRRALVVVACLRVVR